MKRLPYSALLLAMLLLLAACGGQAEVDEELLPTRVPTLAAEAFAAPTATPVPPAPTATPEATAPAAVDETDTESDSETDTEAVAETEAITGTESVAETDSLTETESVTDGAEITDTVEVTATEDAATTGARPLLPPSGIAETGEVTDTEEIKTGEAGDEESDTEITVTDTVTDTETDVDVETDVITGTDTVTTTVDITETTEITQTSELDESDADTEADAEEDAADAGTAGEEATGEVDPAWAGLPDEIIAAMAAADPVRGQQLTLTNACIGCHNTDPSMPMVGPTWHNLATTAETRIPGTSAGLYLYNSIIHPNDYVVEGYLPGIMLQLYGSLPPQDLADIVSYLLTLHDQP